MDIISKTYFKKFLTEQKISGGETTANFEKFINYIVLEPKNITNFDLASVCVGYGDDAGIDGLAISVNNRFINNIGELNSYIELGMELSVEFYFIQSKTSSTFECKEIRTFGEGVVDSFRLEDEIKKNMNSSIKEKYKMIRRIIDNYEYTKERKCYLYYVTVGKYIEDINLLSTKKRIIEDIERLGLFKHDDINIYIEGSDYIRKQYESTKIQNSATFKLSSKLDIPYIKDVEKSYFAIMPIKEYLNIIIDDENKVRRGIFELNVRDFGGIEGNRVNQDIEATILSKSKSSFGLLNNGITIVGNSLSEGQGKYTIKNFYIVNGCQTTNVLYENREKIDDDMWISVKIVITQDNNIIKDIVKATNNQTEVQEIQLLSMDEYQEKLESYYNSFMEYKQLYYERRDGQYRGNPKISPIEIVSPDKQMKSFAAIFLKSPQISSRFIGKLQDEISKKIFVKEHKPIMYYTASLLNYYIEDYLRNNKIDNTYAKFQYHLQLAISQLVWKGKKQPAFNSEAMEEYCLLLVRAISNEVELEILINKAKDIIQKVVGNINDTEANKTVTLVKSILRFVEIELTEKELRDVKYFINNIDTYLAPFDAMKYDGDKRFNFKERHRELLRFISKYNMNSIINSINDIENIEIDEEDRESRKCKSELICSTLNSVRKLLNDKIDKSRKYEN